MFHADPKISILFEFLSFEGTLPEPHSSTLSESKTNEKPPFLQWMNYCLRDFCTKYIFIIQPFTFGCENARNGSSDSNYIQWQVIVYKRARPIPYEMEIKVPDHSPVNVTTSGKTFGKLNNKFNCLLFLMRLTWIPIWDVFYVLKNMFNVQFDCMFSQCVFPDWFRTPFHITDKILVYYSILFLMEISISEVRFHSSHPT